MIDYPTINRNLLLVVPKQPFYDWSNKLFSDLAPTQASDVQEHNSYLLEEELFLDDPEKELKNYWKSIFINELFGQCTDESTFPKLSWKLFTEWFNFYRSSVIMDLSEDPLYTQHYD